MMLVVGLWQLRDSIFGLVSVVLSIPSGPDVDADA